MGDIADAISKYGFPIVMAFGMGFILHHVWEWCTKEVKPVLGDANTVLIALIDRIRCLDNDLIRLNQKVTTVLHLRGKAIEYERVLAEKELNEVHHHAHKDSSNNETASVSTINHVNRAKTKEDSESPIGKRKATKSEIQSAAGDD